MNEPCSSLRCVNWCLTFFNQYPICILVYSALSLLCLCGGVERPLLYPLLECMSIFFSISHVCTRCHVFSCRSRSGVMRPHSPSPFLHSRRVVLECSDACVVSLFGQSVPEVPYARSSPACTWNSAFPFLARATRPLLPWLARWTRPLARASQDAMSRRRLCAVHEPAICGYDRSFAALSNSISTRPFLIPPALWLYRKTRCGCRWGGTEMVC